MMFYTDVYLMQMYPKLIRDFMADDHEHSVCAVSEAVQIFTVPTLVCLFEIKILIVFYDFYLFSSQQHYPTLIREFIKDDHIRSVSTTSCSVQIFTVPTLVG